MFLKTFFDKKHEFISKNGQYFCCFITNHSKNTLFFAKKIKITLNNIKITLKDFQLH